MRVSKKNLFKLLNFARENYLYIIGGVFLFVIFFINTFHEVYPDEFDNILGGRYILEGKIIYKDFFTHHGPVSYFIASIVLFFTGNSFVNFRIGYSVFLFLVTVLPYFYLRRSIGHKDTKPYLFLAFTLAVASVYFWGQMLLADNVAAFLLLPVLSLLVLKSIYKKALTFWDVLFIAFFSALAFLSSLTYSYLVAIIYLYTMYFFLKERNELRITKKAFFTAFKAGLILVAPLVLFAVYLLLTGSFGDYYYQNFTFNQTYYVYNYPRADGNVSINPVRYAVIIVNKFIMQFTVLLIQVKDFNFNFPYNITLALANVALLAFLLFKKKLTLALFVLLVLIFSNVRSNPLTSDETDYQSAVYMMFSLFNLIFIPVMLYRKLKKDIEFPKKLIYSVLFILLLVYGTFTAFFLLRSFAVKAYGKYMGTMPRIYDRPQVAPLINDITKEGEFTWVGPFEFKELFYTDAKIASRYQILNPGMGDSPFIQDTLIQNFEENKPKVIWFDKRFHVLGRSPEDYAQKFINYLDKNYYTLYEYRDAQGRRYIPDYPFEQKVDIETKLYIRPENIGEIINRLLEKGYIKTTEE